MSTSEEQERITREAKQFCDPLAQDALFSQVESTPRLLPVVLGAILHPQYFEIEGYEEYTAAVGQFALRLSSLEEGTKFTTIHVAQALYSRVKGLDGSTSLSEGEKRLGILCSDMLHELTMNPRRRIVDNYLRAFDLAESNEEFQAAKQMLITFVINNSEQSNMHVYSRILTALNTSLFSISEDRLGDAVDVFVVVSRSRGIGTNLMRRVVSGLSNETELERSKKILMEYLDRADQFSWVVRMLRSACRDKSIHEHVKAVFLELARRKTEVADTQLKIFNEKFMYILYTKLADILIDGELARKAYTEILCASAFSNTGFNVLFELLRDPQLATHAEQTIVETVDVRPKSVEYITEKCIRIHMKESSKPPNEQVTIAPAIRIVGHMLSREDQWIAAMEEFGLYLINPEIKKEGVPTFLLQVLEAIHPKNQKRVAELLDRSIRFFESEESRNGVSVCLDCFLDSTVIREDTIAALALGLVSGTPAITERLSTYLAGKNDKTLEEKMAAHLATVDDPLIQEKIDSQSRSTIPIIWRVVREILTIRRKAAIEKAREIIVPPAHMTSGRVYSASPTDRRVAARR